MSSKLYIVRWADHTFSLISARDDYDLIDKLDQAGDPNGALWREYNGPLWIDFGPPQVEPPDFDDKPWFSLPISANETDESGAMLHSILGHSCSLSLVNEGEIDPEGALEADKDEHNELMAAEGEGLLDWNTVASLLRRDADAHYMVGLSAARPDAKERRRLSELGIEPAALRSVVTPVEDDGTVN